MIALAGVELLFTYFLKYKLNYLSFSEFSISNLGNIFNLILTLIVIAGLFANYILKKDLTVSNYYGILVLLIFQLALLTAVCIIFIFNIPLPKFYLWNYPSRKIMIAGLLIGSKIIHIYIIGLLWNYLFTKGIFVHLKSFGVIVVTSSLLFIFAFVYHLLINSENNQNKHYDAAVVLGAAVWSNNKPSPIFRGRIEKAFNLYKNNRFDKIQLTGGNAPGEISEAAAARNLLIELGADADDLWIEENTSTTSEQIRFIKRDLVKLKGIKKIVIISDDFHLQRVLEMCRFFNVDATGIYSDYKISWEKLFYYRFRDTIGLLLFWIFAI